MSYPPQPPSGQQWPGPPQGPPQGPPPGPPPGWGPPSGPPQGPPGFPPQGPPGFGQYGGGYGGPPKKSRVGLVVGLVALVVALIAGIVVTAVLVANGDDDGDKTAGKDPSSTSSSSPTEATSSPTEASSATTPATPYSPTDDTGDDVHSDVKTSDFPGDWNFQLGDVKHDAKLLDKWDYDTCSPVEEGTVLTKQRCEYAAQWTYSAFGGKARVTHIFLVFDTERHAKAAQAKISDKDFDLREESVFPDFVQGKYNTSVYGNLVGVTVGTTKVKVDEKRLQSLVNYMNTDYKVALSFKQL